METLNPDTLAFLTSYSFAIPQGGDRVYKEECNYCFNDQECENGLYVCLSSLYGVCKSHLGLLVRKKGKTVFLNITKVVKKITKADDEPPAEKRPTKMAIGVEGGFDVDKPKVEYETITSLIITDTAGNIQARIPLPDASLPLNVQLSIAAVIAHQGACLQDSIAAWEDKRIVSKHAHNLQQLDNGVKIAPNGWKCALCDLTSNLWLNLTDGTILCGRRYFDGSGGNNHAVEYYEQTKYPLAVKLGTITAEGGDVYSYDEDDMVEDPNLKQHLLHFGINIALLEKTEKTMTELEIEANLSLKSEWDTIQEAGKKLKPLYGPGYTGMINLGNSCYLNSIMQILFSMDNFQSKYVARSNEIFDRENGDPTRCFNVQMAKLGTGLHSGLYSAKISEDEVESKGVRPQTFKALIGRGHPEFSTNHQQDAQEFFLHFLELLEKNEKEDQIHLKDNFTFQFEDRVECTSSHHVAYKKREDLILSLPIPLDKATNIAEYENFEIRCKEAEERKERIPPEDNVRLIVPMSACIEAFSSTETVEQFYSSAIKSKTTALKRTRFATFPDYLVIQLRKFTVSEDWTPKKLDVCVEMEDVLDLSGLRGTGLQANETLLVDEEESGEQSAPVFNEEYIAQLVDIGFPLEACKKAVHFTNNQGVEPAMNWIFEHSQDADFADPLQLPKTSSSSSGPQTVECDVENVKMLVSMGFTEEQAKKALKKNNNNLESAAEFLLTRIGDLDAMEVDNENDASSTSEKKYHDGEGKYKLIAFSSHMGTSTSCGHYVCHIIKDDRWVIFNDRKVAESETPPKGLGYIYFYKRIS